MARRSSQESVHRRTPTALEGALFGPEEHELVRSVRLEVEQLVGEFFHLTSFGSSTPKLEIVSLEGTDLAEAEASHALAKLCRYDRKERSIGTSSKVGRYYKVFLQDGKIIAKAQERGWSLRALLTYVLAHELVHVVRFETFAVHIGAEGEARAAEEEQVHDLTCKVLAPLKDEDINAVAAALVPSTEMDVVE